MTHRLIAAAALSLASAGAMAYDIPLTGIVSGDDSLSPYYEQCNFGPCHFSGAYSGFLEILVASPSDGVYQGNQVTFAISDAGDYPYDVPNLGPLNTGDALYGAASVTVKNGLVTDFSGSIHYQNSWIEAANGNLEFRSFDNHDVDFDITGTTTLLTAVPEPTPGLMLLAGLSLLGFAAGRTRRLP